MVDQWLGSSDIFTDYEGTIVEASFQTNEYGTQMKLVFDEIDGREDPVIEYYKVPDSYESNDGGDTIERVDGKDKAMSKNSKWMRFVMKAAACGNGVREALGEDAPLDSKAWVGARFRMEAEEGKPYKVKDRDTGETKEGVSKDINFPVAFLGKDEVANTPTSNGNGKVDSLSVLTDLHNPVVEAQIADLAKGLPYTEWFQKSYALFGTNGIQTSDIPDLINAMAGRRLYESLGGKG